MFKDHFRQLIQYKQWKKENPKGYYAAFKAEVFDHLGGKCHRCGQTDPVVLQIDHVEGGGGRAIREIGWSKRYREALLTKPNTKYQLLCADCHWRKRHENKEHAYSRASKIAI